MSSVFKWPSKRNLCELAGGRRCIVSVVLKTFIKASRVSLNKGDKTGFPNIQATVIYFIQIPVLKLLKISLSEDSCFTGSHQVLPYNEVRQLPTHIHGFPSRWERRVELPLPSGGLCQLSISHAAMHTWQPQNSPHPPLPSRRPHICSLHPHLYFGFAHRFICTIFLESTYTH